MGNSESVEIFHEGELEDDFRRAGGTGNTSMWELFQKGYKQLVNFIIQPDRKVYTVGQLGPLQYDFMDIRINRKDFELETAIIGTRKLVGSIWTQMNIDLSTMPCIIYLHSNIGCRLDALKLVNNAIINGFCVVAFDFVGCGHSGNGYVTGGLKESQDIGRVVAYIRMETAITDVFLWAHSLGAAAAILYSAHNNVVSGLVLDSAYTSLTQLADDLVGTVKTDGIAAPYWILKRGSNMICTSIEHHAQFQVEKVRPIDYAAHCSMPALLLTACNDKYVPIEQANKLTSAYGGQIRQLRFEGDHYGQRPTHVVEVGLEFFMAIRSAAR